MKCKGNQRSPSLRTSRVQTLVFDTVKEKHLTMLTVTGQTYYMKVYTIQIKIKAFKLLTSNSIIIFSLKVWSHQVVQLGLEFWFFGLSLQKSRDYRTGKFLSISFYFIWTEFYLHFMYIHPMYQTRASDPLEMELHTAVRHPVYLELNPGPMQKQHTFPPVSSTLIFK